MCAACPCVPTPLGRRESASGGLECRDPGWWLHAAAGKQFALAVGELGGLREGAGRAGGRDEVKTPELGRDPPPGGRSCVQRRGSRTAPAREQHVRSDAMLEAVKDGP